MTLSHAQRNMNDRRVIMFGLALTDCLRSYSRAIEGARPSARPPVRPPVHMHICPCQSAFPSAGTIARPSNRPLVLSAMPLVRPGMLVHQFAPPTVSLSARLSFRPVRSHVRLHQSARPTSHPSMHPFVRPLVRLSACPSISPLVAPRASACLPFLRLSACVSVHQPARPTAKQPARLSVGPLARPRER